MATLLRIGPEETIITFADGLRADAKEALAKLAEQGIASRILSGDRQGAVEAVAKALDVPATAEAKPQDKLSLLEDLRSQGRKVLMVGDGINDGPALAAAHASIAPGSASDVSQQAADAVFTGKALMPVALAISHARRCMAIVRQNFGLAVVYNICAVPLALAGVVTPLIAAIAMSGSSLIVVGNSLRLARVKE